MNKITNNRFKSSCVLVVVVLLCVQVYVFWPSPNSKIVHFQKNEPSMVPDATEAAVTPKNSTVPAPRVFSRDYYHSLPYSTFNKTIRRKPFEISFITPYLMASQPGGTIYRRSQYAGAFYEHKRIFWKLGINRQLRDMIIYSRDVIPEVDFRILWIFSIAKDVNSPHIEESFVDFLKNLHPGCVAYNVANKEDLEAERKTNGCFIQMLVISNVVPPGTSIGGNAERQHAMEWVNDESWFYLLDNDNSFRSDFFKVASGTIYTYPDLKMCLFSQVRSNYLPKPRLDAFTPAILNVDTAQVFALKSATNFKKDWQPIDKFCNDGRFIEATFKKLRLQDGAVQLFGLNLAGYNKLAEKFTFINKNSVAVQFISTGMLDFIDLYYTYAEELYKLQHSWNEFCFGKTVVEKVEGEKRELNQPPTTPLKNEKCNIGLVDAEILYLKIRHLKPTKVLQMYSKAGFSALVISQALKANNIEETTLILAEDSDKYMKQAENVVQVNFVYLDNLRSGLPSMITNKQFDFLHIDNCVESDCMQWNVDNVLDRIQPSGDKLFVTVNGFYSCLHRYASTNMQQMDRTRIPVHRGMEDNEGNIKLFDWLKGTLPVYLENMFNFCPSIFFTPTLYKEIHEVRERIGLEIISNKKSSSNSETPMNSIWAKDLLSLTHFDVVNIRQDYLKNL